MEETEWLAERCEQHRPRLRAVAYRMLGRILFHRGRTGRVGADRCRVQPGTRGQQRVRDDLFAEAAKHYDGKALATLSVVLASAGFWMNVALMLKPPPVGQSA